MRIDAQVTATRPDRSVLLTASAGSGKTYVLVRRMIHLLAAGASPDEVVAATFTEKAAAQMKDKLYETLSGAVRSGRSVGELLELGPDDAPYPLVRTPQDILSELAARPERLRAGTIHALCLWVLRRFPLEAGLPPEFSVMDDSEIPIRRLKAVDAMMDAVHAGSLMQEFRVLTGAGLSLKDIEELLTELLEKRCHISRIATDHGGFSNLADDVLSGLNMDGGIDPAQEILAGGVMQGAAERLAGLLREHHLDIPGYASVLDTLADVKDTAGYVYAFENIKGFIYTKGKSGGIEFRKKTPVTLAAAKETIGDAEPLLKGKALESSARALKDEHDALFYDLREEVNKLAAVHDNSVAMRALGAFYRLFGKTEAIYTDASRREGLVDYDDLEICAYRLLKGPDADKVLYSLESKVLHYLVDEFQDTGELQWGIIRMLTGEAFSGMGAEGIKAPTLFAVGDTKQSIYRFRMANHLLMGVLKDEMESSVAPEGREFPLLSQNFRSAPEVLKVVDDTFGALFAGSYTPSEPYRKHAKGSVTLRVVDRDGEPRSLAADIAGACGLSVWDADSKGFRPAGYGDMAVLLKSRGRLVEYEAALRERGIPYKIAGGVGFFYRPEVMALLGILNYLDDPADTLSLAAALKSRLFGLSDGEIEPLFNAAEPMDALKDISPEAHRLFSGWREKAGVTSVGRLVEHVLEDSAALFGFGLNGGPPALLNIEKLGGLAREFDRRGGAGLSEFTEWARAYRDNSELATADVELPGTREFVSIMTVHAAKGLEFPVVFIPGADRKPNAVKARFIAGMEHRGMTAIKTDALLGENPGYAMLKDEERQAAQDEAERLLYVAMTRAMDHLFISTGGNPGKDGVWSPPKGSWSHSIVKARPVSLFGDAEDVGVMPTLYNHPAGILERNATGVTQSVTAPAWDARRQRPAAEMTAPLPATPGVSFLSPSSLATVIPEDASSSRPYPATVRGTLIHRAIESLGKTGTYDVARAAGSVPGFGLLENPARKSLVKDVEATLAGLLEDDDIRSLLSPGEGKLFELPLLLRLETGAIVQGYADLVVTGPDHAAVYDFKSGLEAVPVETIRSAYAPQLEAYRSAVSEAFGIEHVPTRLLLVDRRKIIEL